MNPLSNPLVRLLNSSKALVVVATVAGAILAVHFKVWSGEEAKDLIKYVVSAFLVAVGGEDAAKHLANGKVNAAVASGPTPPATINITNSIPPAAEEIIP